jgi:hypothetical protein
MECLTLNSDRFLIKVKRSASPCLFTHILFTSSSSHLAMPRPRVHFSEVAKQEALRASKARYYTKQVTNVPLALPSPESNAGTEMRSGLKCAYATARSIPEKLVFIPISESRFLFSFLLFFFLKSAALDSKVDTPAEEDPVDTLSAKVVAADQALDKITAGCPVSYAAHVYDRLHKAAQMAPDDQCSDIIDDAIQAIQGLFAPMPSLLDEILQLDGYGPAYQAAQKVVRRFKTVIGFLEDMQCEQLLGTANIISMHQQGALLHQTY